MMEVFHSLEKNIVQEQVEQTCDLWAMDLNTRAFRQSRVVWVREEIRAGLSMEEAAAAAIAGMGPMPAKGDPADPDPVITMPTPAARGKMVATKSPKPQPRAARK